MLERSITAFALLGAEWVLYLLLILSILSIAIMIERSAFYLKRRTDIKSLSNSLSALLDKDDLAGAEKLLSSKDLMSANVVLEGVRSAAKGLNAAQERMAGELVLQRTRFERRLIFLGTLGNNAPFIGLFGTVLGIIRAFRDLALSNPDKATNSASAVMAGISEALVATAVGLAVALPAVVAYNYFKSVVKTNLSDTETLSKVLTAYLGTESQNGK